MSLRDVMSSAGLAIFAEVALVLFLGAFVAICISVLSKDKNQHLEKLSRLPLEAPLPDAPHPRAAQSSDRPSS